MSYCISSRKFYSLIAALLLLAQYSVAQTVIKGKVTDAANSDPIAFANVVVTGTSAGSTTNFSGWYSITTYKNVDSISAAYLGYDTKTIAFSKASKENGYYRIDFQLNQTGIKMQDIVITSGENPAYAIIRKAKKNKKQNNTENIKGFTARAFTRLELDMDNIEERYRKKKLLGSMVAALDSIKTLTKIVGEDGEPLIPIFLSESISDVYYRTNPVLKKEYVHKVKVTGLGVETGEFASQFVGNSLQDFNFYNNWVKMNGKFFISPIADSWRLYYEYYLIDSMYIDGDYCYRIDFEKRRPADLGFEGSIWINKKDYAIKQIDAKLGREANLNFIDKLRVRQVHSKTEAGPYVPLENRITIDFTEVARGVSAGMLAKFYSNYTITDINNPKPIDFFNSLRVERAEDAFIEDPDFWKENRPDTTYEEQLIYNIIDTIKQVKAVKRWTKFTSFMVDGYFTFDNFFLDLGPYIYSYAYNDIEGNRMRVGFRSSYEWSKKIQLYGYLAYGSHDKTLKYHLNGYYILSRKRWTTIGAEHHYDIGQVATMDIRERPNMLMESNPLFAAFMRWGQLSARGPFFRRHTEIYADREVLLGWTPGVTFRHFSFAPLYDFEFANNPGDVNTGTITNFETAEVEFKLKWAKKEVMMQRMNSRISMGGDEWPIAEIKYTRGLDILGADFTYNKFYASVYHQFRLGTFGRTRYLLEGSLIPEVVPYPLLTTHLGNESPIFNYSSYNLMNFFEFTSDRYISLRWKQDFEGLLSSFIPGVSKLKLRFFGTARILYGTLSEQNRLRIQSNFTETPAFFSLEGIPYVEVGYGIQNIFEFFRIDIVHRLTHLDKPNTSPIGVLGSFRFSL